MKVLSLVIPTYNEESNLDNLFDAIDQISVALQTKTVNLEVVIVDNKSTDQTWVQLLNWANFEHIFRVTLVQHPKNLGMQQSLLSGIRQSTGDAVAVMQSDLQDPPEVVIEMCDEWLRGSKYIATRIETRQGAFVPRIGAWLFYRLLSFVSDSLVIPDSSDFYLFDSTIRQFVINESGTTPFLRSTLSSYSKPDVILKYKRLDRESGISNFSLNRRINFAFDAMLRNLSGLVKKTIGLAMIFWFTSLTGLVILGVAYLGGYRSPVSGWFSTVGLLLVILSTTMFIGAVSLEILSRLYREMPRRDFSDNSLIRKF